MELYIIVNVITKLLSVHVVGNIRKKDRPVNSY